ncbi:glycosyltransferase family 10 domain-containing protein [Hyunsoonleella ulvae]|uniref:glycosyltransferase family 10 domain-containing protein n=1 Tax=Hyunsoonleella ulvae TaxID=2799948 RepID=UPI00193A42D6|nr:glycosyltransferase family 10 [Hyunsoonleella ulvae]
MIVRICRYYKYPDIKRQTPRQSFIWDGITFTEDEVKECDFLVILDYPKKDIHVKVNPNNIIHICLEPANEISKYRQYANKQVSIIYNQIKNEGKFVKSHPVLPWHLDKDYDYFKHLKPEHLDKKDKIAWVTSSQRSSKQHNMRMDFLELIRDLPFMDICGRGIKEVESKWDVMKTAKYAIAYENFKNPYNWTEKISDCFLSYTVPLYFGCNRIEEYFPKEAIIQIDPSDKYIKTFLKETLNSQVYNEKIEALVEARNLFLDKYQLFPFIVSQIRAVEAKQGVSSINKKVEFHFKGGNAYYDNYPSFIDLQRILRKVKRKLNR